ncbi:glycosyltransferase family 4 protein [Candidatus Peregrinibacteria bacterium]|nr:glycosyltransferase family 4 protein [Candidatus Peregrinibacteria bacterium]
MKTDEKIHILFYTDTPLLGGAENQMYLLAKFLDKEKYLITLVCSGFKNLDEWAKKFENENIQVVRLNVAHKHDLRHYFQLKEYLRHNAVDLMHVHVWNPASCRYALKLAGKYNVPTVITEHDPFELPRFKKYITRKLLKNVNHVIAVSDSNQKLLLNLYPELENRITAIHNGIDVTWFESQLLSFNFKHRDEYRKQHFNATKNSKIILSVAELHERKGLKYLIHAMPKVIESCPTCKLVLAGAGPEEDKLKNLAKEKNIKNNVIFLGFRKDIPQIMKSADVFVLPSVKEAFGLVLLEAMAAELPIIASEVGGIPEIIENGVNGMLISPHDEDRLANGIIKLLNDPKLTDKFITTGFKLLKKAFDAKIMAKKTEAIYDEVLSNTMLPGTA